MSATITLHNYSAPLARSPATHRQAPRGLALAACAAGLCFIASAYSLPGARDLVPPSESASLRCSRLAWGTSAREIYGRDSTQAPAPAQALQSCLEHPANFEHIASASF
jgi:hypothetical protein